MTWTKNETSRAGAAFVCGEAGRIYRRHQLVVLRLVGACVGLTLVLSVLLLVVRPRYVGVATVTMMPSRFELGFTSRRADLSGMSPAMVLTQTHREFLLSRTLAEAVTHDLVSAPGSQPAAPAAVRALRGAVGAVQDAGSRVYALLNYGRWSSADAQERLIRRVQRSIAVDGVPGSYILRVSVTWDDPVLAARAANLVTDRYVKLALSENSAELAAARQYIESEMAATRKELQDVEGQIQTYKQTEGVYVGTKDVIIKLEALSAAQQEYNTTVAALREQETKLSALKPYQAPTTLAAEDATRAGLEARKESLEQVIAAQSTALGAYPAQESALLELYRVKAEKTADFSTLRERQMQTRIAEAAQVSAVRVIDPATTPPYPVGPQVIWNVLAAAVAGVLLGGVYALLREYFAPSHGVVATAVVPEPVATGNIQASPTRAPSNKVLRTVG